jgi:unspecific monooxygenase
MDVATLITPPCLPVPERPLSIPGFLRAMRVNALTMWPDSAYDEDIQFRSLFGRPYVLINAPEAIHHVLVDNPENYTRSPASIRILRPLVGNGLLLSKGESWRLQRRTIAPSLAPRVMPLLARHVLACAEEAIVRLSQQAAQPVDLLSAMQFLALEVAGRSMFSLEMTRFGAAMRAMLLEYSVRLAPPHLLDVLLPPSVTTLRDWQRRRFQARWMALVESMIHDRMSLPEADAPRDLFDLLRAARDPETGQGFSPLQLRDQVATMILAGHETTAVTLFWALYLLSLDQDEQARIANEVDGDPITPEALPRLIRTRAVVDETLRLYPPAFVLVRAALGPDRLPGLDVTRGLIVMIAPWVLHRHRRLWRDPEAFDPTRFMPDAPKPPRFAYLPFGAGPRICIGAQFALTEATLVLAALVQRFRVALAPGERVLPRAIVTTQPDHPARFVLETR